MRRFLALLGPGLAVAATGVGAGDMVSAANAGSEFGYAIAWAGLAGAGLKFVLNEGLARWQLATGTTLLEGWVDRLGSWVRVYFLAYLLLWSFVVGGALISACGLAGHALAPWLPFQAWGMMHSLVCVLLVLAGGYAGFERLMGLLTALMFVALVGSAVWGGDLGEAARGLVFESGLPRGGGPAVLGLLGGVGGSLTLLSYGYWIRERGWDGPSWLGTVRRDLGVAYLLTGLFGLSVVVLSARALHGSGTTLEGARGVVQMAEMLRGGPLGDAGAGLFLVGFWAAVATSMLGVWQSVPYLFCDFVALVKRLAPEQRAAFVSTRSAWYRGYLAWLALAPMSLLLLGRPVALIVAYAIIGALFMPFLAGTLLFLNRARNGPLVTAILALSLLLFAWLTGSEILEAIARL